MRPLTIDVPDHWPVDTAEEKAALGACLLGQGIAASRLLVLDDFSLSSHREIFAAILVLLRQGEPTLELPLLAAELRKRGTLEAVGGVPYLSDLDFGVVPARRMESRMKRLRELADRRRVLRFLEKAMDNALDPTQPIEQTKAWFREAIR